MGLPSSHRVSRVPWYSLAVSFFHNFNYRAGTLFRPGFNTGSFTVDFGTSLPQNISASLLGSYPFARHYLGNRWFTFSSSGYLDGSVPRVPFRKLCVHLRIPVISYRCVPAFGYLRIEVYLRLPAAFRSLSRPSSAPDAWASSIRSL